MCSPPRLILHLPPSSVEGLENLAPRARHPSLIIYHSGTSNQKILIIHFLAVSWVIWGQDLVVIYKKASTDDKCFALVIWLEPLLSSSNCLFSLSLPPVTKKYKKISFWVFLVQSSLCSSAGVALKHGERSCCSSTRLNYPTSCYVIVSQYNPVWSRYISNYRSKTPSGCLLMCTHYSLLCLISLTSLLNHQAFLTGTVHTYICKRCIFKTRCLFSYLHLHNSPRFKLPSSPEMAQWSPNT